MAILWVVSKEIAVIRRFRRIPAKCGPALASKITWPNASAIAHEGTLNLDNHLQDRPGPNRRRDAESLTDY